MSKTKNTAAAGRRQTAPATTTPPPRAARRDELELRTAEVLDDIEVIGDLVFMAGESGHNPMKKTMPLLGMMLMRLSKAASDAVDAERRGVAA